MINFKYLMPHGNRCYRRRNCICILQQGTWTVFCSAKRNKTEHWFTCIDMRRDRSWTPRWYSEWNIPTALCTYRSTVFVCDTGNKAVRMLTSAKKTCPPTKRNGKICKFV